MVKNYEFKVEASSKEAVSNLLSGVEGVNHYHVHIKSQQVFIESHLAIADLTALLNKTGLNARYVGESEHKHSQNNGDKHKHNDHGHGHSHNGGKHQHGGHCHGDKKHNHKH